MSMTKMKARKRKRIHSEDVEVIGVLGASATPPSNAISPPLSTQEPHSSPRMKKTRKSPDSSEENPSQPNASEQPSPKKRKLSIDEIEVDVSKPEPPSKKALRHLKKGKPLPSPRNGADPTPEPDEAKPKNSEVKERSGHGIWIGNLPWSVTKTDLRTFLTSNSGILDATITRIHMPSPDDGKPANRVEESKPWKKQHNKGFAYVDFSVPEAVREAVELSEQLLSGRRVLIKDNKSFEGRPQKTKDESKNESKPLSKRVFLGNLRFDTTEDSLKEHFERCGAIESIMVATFEDSGKCKGYAWITFEELEAAQNAVRGYVLAAKEDEDGTASESEREGNAGEEAGSENNEEEVVEVSEQQEEEIPTVQTKPKKPIIKKWWVDMIHKRPVRREFAEAAQVRYKKRYGKDGTKNRTGASTAADPSGREAAAEGPGDGIGDGKKRGKVLPLRQVEYRKPYAPRLTGGIVESEGRKVIF